METRWDSRLSHPDSCPTDGGHLTRDRLGIPFWDYLGSRLKVAGHAIVEALDRYVRRRIRYA